MNNRTWEPIRITIPAQNISTYASIYYLATDKDGGQKCRTQAQVLSVLGPCVLSCCQSGDVSLRELVYRRCCNKRVPYGVWICPSYPGLFRCALRSDEFATRPRLKIIFLVQMNSNWKIELELTSKIGRHGHGNRSTSGCIVLETHWFVRRNLCNLLVG